MKPKPSESYVSAHLPAAYERWIKTFVKVGGSGKDKYLEFDDENFFAANIDMFSQGMFNYGKTTHITNNISAGIALQTGYTMVSKYGDRQRECPFFSLPTDFIPADMLKEIRAVDTDMHILHPSTEYSSRLDTTPVPTLYYADWRDFSLAFALSPKDIAEAFLLACALLSETQAKTMPIAIIDYTPGLFARILHVALRFMQPDEHHQHPSDPIMTILPWCEHPAIRPYDLLEPHPVAYLSAYAMTTSDVVALCTKLVFRVDSFQHPRSDMNILCQTIVVSGPQLPHTADMRRTLGIMVDNAGSAASPNLLSVFHGERREHVSNPILHACCTGLEVLKTCFTYCNGA